MACRRVVSTFSRKTPCSIIDAAPLLLHTADERSPFASHRLPRLGSLVWKVGPLALASNWAKGGPRLPIEFCRVGDGGELATAIQPGMPPVPTRWALLATSNLVEAREQLRRREGIPEHDSSRVGDAPLGDPSLQCAAEIRHWAAVQGLDHVVWTALPARFAGQEGRLPTVDEAVAYLQALHGELREHAEHYVRSVATEIRTPYRAAFETRLGWTPRAA